MTLLPLNETDICHSASSGDARPRGIFRVGLSPREMCEVWGRVCARSDSDRDTAHVSDLKTPQRHNTHGHPHRAAAGPRAILLSKHCCVWMRRATWKRHPSPASTGKCMPLASLARARTPLRQHFELILQPEMVQRIQHVCFNTFAADLPVVSVLRLAERARTPGHPACCSLAQVGQPIRWGRTWAPACTRTSGHPTLHLPGRTWAPPLMQEFRRRVRQIVGGGVHSEVLQPFPSGLRKRMGEWTRRSGCGDWTVTATFTFAHIDEVLARDRLAIRVACQLRCPGRDEAHKFRGGLLHQKLGFRDDLAPEHSVSSFRITLWTLANGSKRSCATRTQEYERGREVWWLERPHLIARRGCGCVAL